MYIRPDVGGLQYMYIRPDFGIIQTNAFWFGNVFPMGISDTTYTSMAGQMAPQIQIHV